VNRRTAGAVESDDLVTGEVVDADELDDEVLIDDEALTDSDGLAADVPEDAAAAAVPAKTGAADEETDNG
jgi:hypothetical protein